MVAAIEESRNLTSLSGDELSRSLQAHEARLNKSAEKHEEKAFSVKGDASHTKATERGALRENERSVSKGDRDKGRSFDQRQSHNDYRNYKSHVQCNSCKKHGHAKAECWFKDKNANYAKEDEVSNLIVVRCNTNDVANTVWLVNSGCLNHMTLAKELINELDELQKQTAR